MLIDFTKIVGLIPDEGRLVLTFTSKGMKESKSEGTELSIVVAQHFKGKENDNDFSPLIITGTIPELTESFEATITDIARDQTTLAALKATATTTKVGQKKKQLAEAIQKHTADQKKEPEKAEKKVETREEKPKPSMTDLFSMSPASPAKKDEQPTAQTEALEEAQEVDHV
ncbi:MAG: hypothetical protein ABSC55_03570 [Syntrophorhabdales bacterium]|jgi:hypothetical protein